MSEAVGLWIDHKKAVIVKVAGGEISTVESNMEKHVRYKQGARPKTAYGPQHGAAEDEQDRKYTEHLNKYYNRILARVRRADPILIFGPGEAKIELEKRLARTGLKGRGVTLETAGKMTDRQIAAKVRRHFNKRPAGTRG